MPTQSNPYDAVVTQLEADERKLLADIANVQAWYESRSARANDWPAGSPQSNESMREAYEASVALNRLRAELETVQRKLAAAHADQERIDQAIAEAMAQGLTPEAAMAKVVGAEQRKKVLTYTAVGLLVLGIIVLVVWYIRKRRKK